MSACEVFVFLGPPGAGKGSLSQLCVKNLGWMQIAAGNLCRKHIINGTAIGKEIERAIQCGQLAPEELVSQLVFDWLCEQSQASCIILDGFPRTVLQAQLLDAFLEKHPHFKLNVVKLVACDEHVLQRMLTRSICRRSDCQMVYSTKNSLLGSKDGATCDACGDLLIKRPDDSLGSIQERLRIYHKHEQDLTRYYSGMGKEIHRIDVELPLSVVFDNFVRTFSPQAPSYTISGA